ncbi:hypothetical protein METHPM2_760002 [Pseudomonas sp. PM2]
MARASVAATARDAVPLGYNVLLALGSSRRYPDVDPNLTLRTSISAPNIFPIRCRARRHLDSWDISYNN